MVRRAHAAACAAAFALFVAPRVAEAAPVLRIKWPTVPGCPGSSVVVQRARAAIAQAKQVDDVLAIAEITPPETEGEPWLLHVRVRTVRGAGERSLEAPSCEALARAAGLLIAIAALRARNPDIERPLDELAPAADRVEAPGAFTSPIAILPSRRAGGGARSPTSASDESAHFVPSAGFGVAIGILPSLAVGPNVTLGYEAGPWSAGVGLRVLLPQEATTGGLGAEFVAFGAGFDVCRRLPIPVPPRAMTHACAGGRVDDVHASGVGPRSFDARRTVASAFAGVGAAWDVGRSFRIGADVRVGAAFERAAFVVEFMSEGQRILHRPAVIQGEGTLTFGIVF